MRGVPDAGAAPRDTVPQAQAWGGVANSRLPDDPHPALAGGAQYLFRARP